MQQLMHTFQGLTAPQEVLDAVRRGEIASFCLFENINISTPAQLRELADSLRAAAAEGGHAPPLIGIDQEGGQLMAVTGGVTELPGNMALGATRSPELAYQAGKVLALELLAMGANVNFAPSLDVNVNPENPVIGIRSFGDDPKLVAELGVALIRGLQDQGVMASAKHFPGHGDTASDTHHIDAILSHSLERINSVELVPFRAAIAAGVESVMSAHIRLDAIDPDLPATLSRKVMHDLLREQMGFKGLVITDAMDMHAAARYGRYESIQLTLDAGVDLVLLAHIEDQFELHRHFAKAERPESLARIRAARARMATELPPFEIIGSREHQEIARQIAEAAITLVKDAGRLPLRPASDDRIAVITPEPVNLTPADTSAMVKIELMDRIAEHHPNTRGYELPFQASESDIAALLAAVADADTVIVGTINVSQDPRQAELVRELYQRGKNPVVVALRTPYDLSAFPMIDTYLCAYGIRSANIAATADVLFGAVEARGILPCTLTA
jgi:beta-N-acetylhexosaminidase